MRLRVAPVPMSECVAEVWRHHSCRYAVQKGAYDEYFSKLTGQYNNTWSAPEGENDASSLRVATVAATAVILSPLVLLGAKIGMQWIR